MIAKAESQFAFGYGAFDQATNLFIRAHIFNITSGAPVLVTTVNMVHDGFGCYSGRAVGGSDGETFSINMVAYTDGTYTTPDLNRSVGKTEVDFISFAAAVGMLDPIIDLEAVILDAKEMLATIDADEEFLAFGMDERDFLGEIENGEFLADIETENDEQIALIECEDS